MKSISDIQTQQAAKIAKRLLNHWKHKFEVAESSDNFGIMMPDATILLSPFPDYLCVKIDSRLDNNHQLEHVVLTHLNRMAQQEFEVTWTH